MFCEWFAVFLQNTRKTSKNSGTGNWKTQKTHNMLVYCGRISRAKNRDCIAQNTFHKTSAKHRKTLAKQSQHAFCKITSQNARKTLKTVSKPSQNTAAIRNIARIRCFLPNTLDLCRESTQYCSIYGGGVTYPQAWMFCSTMYYIIACY